METQPDIQQELLKQQQQLQQLMQQEQPKEEEKEQPKEEPKPKPKEERKTLKMPLKGKKKITSMTDQLEHEMTMKILNKILPQYQNSGDMRRLIDLHNEKGKGAFGDLFYAELKGNNARSKPTIASAINNEIANMDITSLFSDVEKSIRSDLDSLIDNNEDEKKSKVDHMVYKRKLTCLLCNTSYKGKQMLQYHYLHDCKQKSLMKSMEVKDFNSDPNKLSSDEINPIVRIILEIPDDKKDLTNLQNKLMDLLKHQYIDHHISNNNIYIANGNYEAKYHIIKDGKWKFEGNYNLFRERTVKLFNNLSKYVEEAILQLSANDNVIATEVWNKMKQLMDDNHVVVRIAKTLFDYTYGERSDLRQRYESSFQHIKKVKKAKK